MLPYAMVGALASSFFLPSPWKWLMLTAQGLFYGLALFDPLIPERSPAKRLSSVIRAFVVLVAAAACALKIFFRSPQQLWKETKVGTAKGQ
jgi:hypothetical protein